MNLDRAQRKPPARPLLKMSALMAHIVLGLLLVLFCGFWVYRDAPWQQRLICWWHRRVLRILGVCMTTTGQLPSAPVLWVANHISWFDIAVLGSLAPLRFVSKAEVARWPFIGSLAGAAGTLFMKRGAGEAATMASHIRNQLDVGQSILLFPEGTSTDGSTVRRFFPQLLIDSVDSNYPIQPVAIRYLDTGKRIDRTMGFVGDDDFLHQLIALTRRSEIQVHIDFLPCVLPEEHGFSARRIASVAQTAVASCVTHNTEKLASR